jgi:hypothetical protein
MREGALNLFMFGAERDAAEWTGGFVKHAYEGAGTGRAFFNTLTAPVWLPVVVFGSAGVSIVKDTGHIVKGAVREGISGVGWVADQFKSVPESVPNIDIETEEETSTRSSWAAHESPPPPPPRPASPRPRPQTKPSPPSPSSDTSGECWTGFHPPATLTTQQLKDLDKSSGIP